MVSASAIAMKAALRTERMNSSNGEVCGMEASRKSMRTLDRKRMRDATRVVK